MKHNFFWLFWLWLLCLPPAVWCAGDEQDNAWDVLNKGLADGNSGRRTQAVTALGSIGTEVRAVSLIETGLNDKDPGVRETAAVVLGQIHARQSIPRLKQALDDESQEVNFTAAKALWEMGDYSGRDIFREVLAGERKTSGGAVKEGIRDAKKKLHNPGSLVIMGLNEGAGALLGPFSLGVGFAEDLLKDKSAPARAFSAKLLGGDPDLQSAKELTEALDDKNSVVRAAAARALGERGSRESIPVLANLLADKNDGVRYMSAAAIIRLSQPSALKSARRNKKIRPASPRPSAQPAPLK